MRPRIGTGAKPVWMALLILLSVSVTPCATFARSLRLNDADYQFDVWETADELPDDTVTALAQTPDGYLWLGTPSGLVRFDGFRFVRFTHERFPGLPATGIRRLKTDANGQLWIGTPAGLCFLQGSRFSAISGSSNGVASITEKDGLLWFAETNGAIASLKGVTLVPVPSPQSPGLFALLQDPTTKAGLWSVSSAGLSRWNDTGWSRANLPPGTDGARILGACPSRNGGIWIATPNSLQLIRSNAVQRQILRKPATTEPLVLSEDSHGHLWTAGADNGLVRHSAAGVDRAITPFFGPQHHRVLAMLEDREGGIWFGTDGGGIIRLKPRRFHPLSGTASHALAHLVESSPGARLLAEPRTGLEVKLADGSSIPGSLLDSVPNATCAVKAPDGRLLIGSPDGLFQVVNGSAPIQVALPVSGPVSVHDLVATIPGETLVATSHGLFILRGTNATDIAAPNGISGALRLLVIGETVYVATLPAGLFVLHDGRLKSAQPGAEDGLGLITALAADPDGRIWFSSSACRLGVLQNGSIETVSDSRLPVVPSFSSLAADETETLWIGSTEGLFHVSKPELRKPTGPTMDTSVWARFDSKDGLASSMIRSASLVLGPVGNRPMLLVGTSKGFSTADPATLHTKSQPCRPIIESLISFEPLDISSGGQMIGPNRNPTRNPSVKERAVHLSLSTPTTLSRKAQRIEVHFTGINFDAPERIHFRYRLLGLQQDWTELEGPGTVPFHSLPPGRFTFQIKASNSDGAWGEEVASAGFIIEPAYWQTLWFRTLIALGTIGGLGGLVWKSSRAHNRRHDLLVEQQAYLAREKARLASVLETTSDVVAFADPELRIFYLNPAGCRTLEVSAPSLDRTLLFDSVLAAESITRFHEEAVPASILRGVWSGEMALQSDAARSLLVSQVMLCHKRPDGSVDFFSFVMRDLSPIKEAEARHEKLEAQLRQAQKMEAVGLLAGGVAHDFNNILQVIMGHSSIALEKEVPADDRENSLIEVKKAARRAAQLTKQLLAFGRRQPLQKLHFDLNLVVREALDMSRRLLGADIEIEFQPADEPAVIYADRGQIEQVVMNLSVNARDAMPRGGRLSISITPINYGPAEGDTSVIGPLPSGPCVRLNVTDNGVGISPENLPHIFEPFFTTKGKNKGSGLGLSVVYGIIQQHGGNLRIDSEVGLGTTFRVYLPASPGAIAAQRVTREIPVKRGSGTILVAEDEEAVRLLATRILQKAGYTVLSARDGEEAVALFREHNDSVDLLLMDVIMPRLSGPEAVKQIRELAPDVPTLYASGYGGEFLKADGRLDIDGEILQKPYQPSELLDRISGFLRKHK
jgi:signal transduction histidine kinase/ligand-binding sensor domain-containing protein/CheY-like chemotaxis protein